MSMNDDTLITLHPSNRVRTVSRGPAGEIVVVTWLADAVVPPTPLGICGEMLMSWITSFPVVIPPSERSWTLRAVGDDGVQVVSAETVADVGALEAAKERDAALEELVAVRRALGVRGGENTLLAIESLTAHLKMARLERDAALSKEEPDTLDERMNDAADQLADLMRKTGTTRIRSYCPEQPDEHVEFKRVKGSIPLPSDEEIVSAEARASEAETVAFKAHARADRERQRAKDAEAQLAALSKAVAPIVRHRDACTLTDDMLRRLATAFANTTTAAEAHDEQVRAEALEEAADAAGKHHFAMGGLAGAERWLRARAKIERGGK